MKEIIRFSLLLILITVLTNCNDDTSDTTHLTKDKITGFAQKGPFNNGSSVFISELNSDFVQTGKNITSSIENNKGLYEIDNIEFISQYVNINVNGYYFNEISGDNSTSQLTLYAISDLSDKNSLNINVLSHIEKERVEYLISEGISFDEAKNQALQEILEIFEIDMPDNIESESLDISQEGEGNSILLAISSICQGFRSTADLSLLLANLSTDIKTDGILDNPSIKVDLISHAKSLNLVAIREKTENHYDDLGISYSIPNFEEHIQYFIENTDFESVDLIEYPEYGYYGENILHLEKDTFRTGQYYCLAANLPDNGSLKIIIKNVGSFIGYVASTNTNWTISSTNNSPTYTSIQSGTNCDLEVTFSMDSLNLNENALIEYYEFGATEPTRIKPIITVDK